MRKYLLFFLNIFFCLNSSSQDFSNKGKEFWLAYSYHVGMVNGGSPVVMTLYITSDVSTTYSVEIYGGAAIQSGNILPNQVVAVIIPNTYFINNEGVFTNKAIHVTAVKPIVVYSFITRSQASAATLALPVNVLGKQYTAMSFTQISNEQNSNSFFTIVAVEDNTIVEIIPTSATKGGWAANSINIINLNKGEIYQVLGTTTGSSGVDLSGSSIRSISSGSSSCKKIAVFSGSGKIAIGCNGSSDNLYQQLYPVGSWGKKYLTVPSYNQPNNYFRVLKSNPATNVYVNGVLIPAASFTNGYYEFFNNIPNLIEADQPISVTQYFTTQNCSGNTNPYDPDMIELNPVEQNINNVTLISSNLTVAGVHQHHLHVIMKNQGTPTTAFSSFKFDNTPVPVSSWVIHPSEPNYSYLYLPDVTETSHTLSCDSGFNALAYGYGDAETYGYSAGTNVRDLYTKAGVSSLYGIEPTASVCVESSFKFKISVPYLVDSIKWDFGSIPNPPAIMVRYPPGLRDSVTNLNGKLIYWYSTPGNYNYSIANTYPFTVTTYSQSTEGCGNIQELPFDLLVSDPPIAGFTNTVPGCVAELVKFTDITTTVKPTYKWSWNFGDPASGADNLSTIKNPSHLFSSPGTYVVKYSNITTPGCISNLVSKQIIVPALPSAIINGTTTICLNSPFPNISFTAAGGTAPYTFTYNKNSGMGPGPNQTISTITGNVNLTVPTDMAGTYIYTLISVQDSGSNLCIQAESGSVTVKINPLPTATISGTKALCLNAPAPDIIFTAAGGTAPYTFTYNVDNGHGPSPNQTITTIAGNSISIAVTTNTAGIFKYSLVSVKDATSTLCSQVQIGSSTITIAPLPTATISGNAELCTNAKSPDVIFTGANGTAPYTFTYSINGGANQIIKTVAGNTVSLSVPTNIAGNFIYKLISVLDAGSTMCSQAQSGTASIKINPMPTADFSFTSPSCETTTINFTDASIPNAGVLKTWAWNFGDLNATVINPDISSVQNPAHIYITAGTYTVTLTTSTDKGCVSILSAKKVIISPNPRAGFIVPEVCLSDAFAQFADTSSIASGSIVNWMWNFGDAASGILNTSAFQHPQHRYNSVGNYTARLTVTSNNGCIGSIAQAFTVNGDIPMANFNFLATTLCANDSVAIQDASTVNFGNITKVEIYWDNLNFPAVSEKDELPVSGKIYKHLYTNFQTPLTKAFSIRYRAYSGIICVNDRVRNIVINAAPKVQFNSIENTCLGAKPYQLTQAAEIGGVPGKGVFTGPGVNLSGLFNPSAAGYGTHTIQFTFTAAVGGCTDTASQKITVYPYPSVNAGPDRVVLQGGSITLQPNVTGNDLQYLWLENKYLNNNRIATPVCTPLEDIKYILTVTGRGGCSFSDDVFVKILLTPNIPNTFSPNNDGVNDFWEIKYLDTYPGNRVMVFTRTGKKVFEAKGYKTPWNGTINGKPLPVDTYYYIVEPGNGLKPITGYVTIIK